LWLKFTSHEIDGAYDFRPNLPPLRPKNFFMTTFCLLLELEISGISPNAV